jgi:hypothetical protein
MLSFLYNKPNTSAKNTITSFTIAGNHKVGFEDILYILDSETTKNKMYRTKKDETQTRKGTQTEGRLSDLRSASEACRVLKSPTYPTFSRAEESLVGQGTVSGMTKEWRHPPVFVLINTLPINSQRYIIPQTIPYHMEEKIINDILNDTNIQLSRYYIILYGKNNADDTVDKKYRQLIHLGFTNVFIYYGGLFEWLLLMDIYGEEKFPLNIYENGQMQAQMSGVSLREEGRRHQSPEKIDLLSLRAPSKFAQI